MAETPEVTPVKEWTVPNQDKLEQVIDARLANGAESDPSETSSNPEEYSDVNSESESLERASESAPTNDEVKDQDPKPKS
jgi:hypothetical protein